MTPAPVPGPSGASPSSPPEQLGHLGHPGVEVIRSEERLRAGVERVVSGTVRIGKRVVTEERTVTVTVRREELFVERLPADPTYPPAGGIEAAGADVRGGGPVLTLTLSEEEPQVSVRVVPREVVRLYVDRVTGEQTVSAEVAREVVEADVDGRPLTGR